MKSRRPFRFKQFEVAQEGGCMPVTTDACIFGAIADIGKAKSALDIGTGTGLLSLMLAQRFPEAHFTAVDIDEASVNQAHLNFENSPWKDRLNAVKADIREWEQGKQFDAIVCNPPFFENQLPSESEDKRRARHTVTLDFETLLQKINTLLNMDGKCWLLLPFLHTQYIENIARINALYIIHKINILSYVESQPHVSIFCISKNNTGSFYSDFIIYNGKGIYSNSMNAIMKYFYLDLIADRQ
jgi:tRNA1Val (adenine37-N6)-methyltransferase